MAENTAISRIDAEQPKFVENVFIPLKIVKRGSYRGKILNETYSTEKIEPDETLINGIVKAYLWEKIIYEQFSGDIGIFCLQNKLSKGYVRQVLKLNLLSPKIKEAILNGKHPKHVLLRDLVRKPFPISWMEQEKMIGLV
jgi:hypothetical protein